MSKYIAVSYQPKEEFTIEYRVLKDSGIGHLLEDVSTSCTGKPLLKDSMELKNPGEHMCFLENLLKEGYTLRVLRSTKSQKQYEVISNPSNVSLLKHMQSLSVLEKKVRIEDSSIEEPRDETRLVVPAVVSKRKDFEDPDNQFYKDRDFVLQK
ncbi:MAG TPA: hypothetical protein VKE88_02215 [Candidatus Nanoarchaeia archaeon]|nr:hypothetical protein [Candidatus Nanoarchaeia archaeon]